MKAETIRECYHALVNQLGEIEHRIRNIENLYPEDYENQNERADLLQYWKEAQERVSAALEEVEAEDRKLSKQE